MTISIGAYCIKPNILKTLKENPSKVTYSEADLEILKIIGSNVFRISSVTKIVDSEGALVVECGNNIWTAGQGLVRDYWCVFTKSQIERFFDKVDRRKDAEEFYTITFGPGPGNTSSIHGPLTEEKAKEFALSQKRNGVDGVRVIVLKQIAEAFVNYEVR